MLVFEEITPAAGVYQSMRIARLQGESVGAAGTFVQTGWSEGQMYSLAYTPSWSPDGQYLAITLLYGPDGTDSDVFIYDRDGNQTSQLTWTPDWQEGPPVWSTDGRHVVASRRSVHTDDGVQQLVAIGTDDGLETVLYSGQGIVIDSVSR
jgi:Tol biopolymer transport system component